MRLTDATRKRDLALLVLTQLSHNRLAELHHRSRFTPADGYPSGGSGTSCRGSHGDPTLARVVSDAGGKGETPDRWPPPFDPVGDALVRIFTGLAEAAGILAQIDRDSAYVLSAADVARDKAKLIEQCCVCSRDVIGNAADPLRGVGEGKACSACHKSWDRAGRPMAGASYQRWETRRRADIAAKLSVA